MGSKKSWGRNRLFHFQNVAALSGYFCPDSWWGKKKKKKSKSQHMKLAEKSIFGAVPPGRAPGLQPWAQHWGLSSGKSKLWWDKELEPSWGDGLWGWMPKLCFSDCKVGFFKKLRFLELSPNVRNLLGKPRTCHQSRALDRPALCSLILAKVGIGTLTHGQFLASNFRFQNSFKTKLMFCFF